MHGQQAGTDQGEAVLAQALAAFEAALGSRLVAAYALGSLAHGGFSPLVSDVDLGLILADPPRLKDRLTVRRVGNAVRSGGSDAARSSGSDAARSSGSDSARSSGTELHQRLSVFWGTPAILQGRAKGGRFPPLDRLDLLEYGRLLNGTDARTGLPRPGPGELLVGGAEFALGSLGGDRPLSDRLKRSALRSPRPDDSLAEIRSPARLVARGPRRVTKVVLFPVRFLFTAATGRVGTNSLAVERYLARPDAPATELVAAALSWRARAPADETALALLNQDLIQLYLHYIDDHIARLDAAGQPRLVRRFRRWRSRLQA
jgi:hypothetical protein